MIASKNRVSLVKIVLITLAPTLLLLGALAFVGQPTNWPPVESSPHQGEALDAAALKKGQAVFSKAALSRLIREPQNTWSNLAFIAGGAYLFSVGSNRAARFLGLPLITVGMGSFIYHASMSPTLRHLDAGSFTWVLVATSLFSIASFFPRGIAKINRNLVAFAALTFFLAVGSTVARKTVVFGIAPLALNTILGVSATILLGSLILLAVIRRNKEIAVKTLIVMTLFGASIVCEVGDRAGNWLCHPEAFIQVHALWHILAAAAFVLTARTLDLPENHLSPYNAQSD